ncbi:hypothetical protein RugamoR64_12960 [Duganella rhizosphaerae]|uniref:hypothetical protein n=1 Tax=Duganella rhizosphaerae TaxID=2885763 RepID=UPI0030E7F079
MYETDADVVIYKPDNGPTCDQASGQQQHNSKKQIVSEIYSFQNSPHPSIHLVSHQTSMLDERAPQPNGGFGQICRILTLSLAVA